MSRADEIAQGLRDPGGALIGGLDAFEYCQGWRDYENGISAPKGITSTSYDLGRARAREKADFAASVLEKLDADARRGQEAVRQMLIAGGHTDELAKYDATIAALRVR